MAVFTGVVQEKRGSGVIGTFDTEAEA
jgi:hypothetical protein